MITCLEANDEAIGEARFRSYYPHFTDSWIESVEAWDDFRFMSTEDAIYWKITVSASTVPSGTVRYRYRMETEESFRPLASEVFAPSSGTPWLQKWHAAGLYEVVAMPEGSLIENPTAYLEVGVGIRLDGVFSRVEKFHQTSQEFIWPQAPNQTIGRHRVDWLIRRTPPGTTVDGNVYKVKRVFRMVAT